MSDRLEPVINPCSLSRAELYAAQLDGEVIVLDDMFVCSDEPDRAELRAEALSSQFSARSALPRLVMMGATAAWLHGVLDTPPPRHEVCLRAEERANLLLSPRFVVRELRFEAQELMRIGAVIATTPLRTVVDLLRMPALSQETMELAARLLERAGISPGQALTAVGARQRLPGKQRVIERLRRLSPAFDIDAA